MNADREELAHLAGYAALVAVLASANWAGLVGKLVGAVFVLGVLAYFGVVGVRALTTRVRAEAEAAADVDAVAADGGDDLLEPSEVRAKRDERIRRVAAIDGVSQVETAEAFGVPQTTVAQVVNAGRMATPETEGSA
jgi:flagellar biosynthesis/type III secretory pathway M-ring protein FliF/YscJ